MSKMIHRIRLVNISMAAYLSFAIVGNIFLHSLDIRKASVAVSFLIEVYPPLKVPAIVGYFLLDQFIGLVMAAVMEIFNAMVHLHIIQIYLLNNYIKQSIVFSGDWTYNWTELLYNESYQNEVYKEIIFIYRRKITLQTFINDLWSKMYIRFIAGIAILIGYLYTIVLIFMLNHFTKVSIIAMLCFSIGYPYGMYHHYNSGQKMQDEYSKVYQKFLEMPWYAWNKKNKKAYLIILTNTQIVTKLPISFNDNFNRLYLIKVSQRLYAFFNFLYKTT
ncbi:uncharacterized protein LOC115891804 isoform X2 [Sitophilus oryzae]|nr:uncharacterized protein LOC115891804 isoform X2 [Sitophilus oryzae]